eukprot:234619-Hanusia_phi.AAC.1
MHRPWYQKVPTPQGSQTRTEDPFRDWYPGLHTQSDAALAVTEEVLALALHGVQEKEPTPAL